MVFGEVLLMDLLRGLLAGLVGAGLLVEGLFAVTFDLVNFGAGEGLERS